jgi:hypothetical protein
MTSGDQGEDLGLLSHDTLVRYRRADDGQSDIIVESFDPSKLPERITEFSLSQFPEFLSFVLLEGLVGSLPDEEEGEVPEAWVIDGGSLSSIASCELSPILAARGQQEDLRNRVIELLASNDSLRAAPPDIANYFDSIINEDSPMHHQRAERQAAFELEM